jgi:hypothetical protein
MKLVEVYKHVRRLFEKLGGEHEVYLEIGINGKNYMEPVSYINSDCDDGDIFISCKSIKEEEDFMLTNSTVFDICDKGVTILTDVVNKMKEEGAGINAWYNSTIIFARTTKYLFTSANDALQVDNDMEKGKDLLILALRNLKMLDKRLMENKIYFNLMARMYTVLVDLIDIDTEFEIEDEEDEKLSCNGHCEECTIHDSRSTRPVQFEMRVSPRITKIINVTQNQYDKIEDILKTIL